MKSLREVGGSVQKDEAHTGVECIDAVLDFTPLSPADREHLSRRKTESRNEVTSLVALLGGRYQQQVAKPHVPGWRDCQRSERLWESQRIG